jgi:hypothetical protein
VEDSGRDVFETTRASVLSLDARAGAAVFLVLGVLSFVQAGAWDVRGPGLGEVISAAHAWYVPLRWGMAAACLVADAVLGALLGVWVRFAWSGVGGLWGRVARERLSRRRQIMLVAAVVLLLHGHFLFNDLRNHPFLFQETFWDRGGFLRWLQRVAVDGEPAWLRVLRGIGVGGVALAALLEVSRRLVRWWMAISRPTKMALWVTGAGVAFFAGGLWGVARVQSRANEGPNLLLLVVDGLRPSALGPGSPVDGAAPRLRELAGQARSFPRCLAPSPDDTASLATLLSGRTPLGHGLHHAYPPFADATLKGESLPAALRRAGYETSVLADAVGDGWRLFATEFDHVSAPSGSLAEIVARRVLERHAALLPYVSGAAGRRLLPILRGSPALADPDLLTDEAAHWLADRRFGGRFFLTVAYGALREPLAIASPSAAGRPRARPRLFARPSTTGDRSVGVGGEDLYRANLAAVDDAVGRLLDRLAESGLDQHTTVALAARPARPFVEDGGFALFRREEDLATPFFVRLPAGRLPPRMSPALLSAEHAAPTLLAALGQPAPEAMDGVSVLMDPEAGDRPLYAETGLWVRPGDPGLPRLPYPPLSDLLEEDPAAPGRLRLSPVWEDVVLSGMNRMVQLGGQRMIYRPTREGVVFETVSFASSTATSPSGRVRTAAGKDMKDLFYSVLAREIGWRPQNEFWIPEALLREEDH